MLVNHAVIACFVIMWDKALVCKKDVVLVPWQWMPGGRELLVECDRGVTP